MIKIKFLQGNCCIKIKFCNHFPSTQQIYPKREGSGAGSASGSVFVTNGSGCGYGMPKNMRILRIRIRVCD
jgi:hypothetical protein